MKTVTITGVMADFLDSIRAYEHESGEAIHYDERESSEFVDMYFSGGGKLKSEEKKPLFTTEDGVEVSNPEDWIYQVNPLFEKIERYARNSNITISKEIIKVFYYEANADEYIWKNKPLFSYEDFIRWGNVPYERVIMQLAKERIEG